MQITGGKVTFERSVKPADYENKRAAVELSYTLEEGTTVEDAEKLLAQVAQQAQERVLTLVGLKQAQASNIVPIVQKPAPKVKKDKPPVLEVDPFVLGTAQPSEPSTPSQPSSPPTSTATADVFNETPQITKSPEDRKPSEEDLLAEAMGEATAPITDAELRDRIARWVNEHKNAKRILELRLKYAGASPKTVLDMPQEQRRAFLTELEGK